LLEPLDCFVALLLAMTAFVSIVIVRLDRTIQ